ncbi:MAG: ribosome biogenesis GTPase Der [Parachlamydiaceae bacterium]|nr:ribosome biogenesis GTPase Der [Parachlamydiaceae bacterium]
MNHLPKLALVGRPNVGKSALFNRICKQKIAIVDEAEGITRDRLYAESDFFGMPFQVIDTGGINLRSKVPFNEEIKRQAEIAIEEADTIIQVVDGHIGLTELDKEVASILLRTKKPVCIAVNKIDNHNQIDLIHQFYSLGITKMIPVSAAQGWHIAELLEVAFEKIPKQEIEAEKSKAMKIAIVGRPNVGKSSLVNYLLDEERCIVSPIPGTTRDSVDISFLHDENEYTLIDTAGIRRKGGEHEVVDKFAAIRTDRAIERADLCILMLDVQDGMTTQDKRIANRIEEAGKGCVILFNKWDLIKGFRMEHCLRSVEEEVPFLKHCPKIFTSAKLGRNVDKIFPVVKEVYENSLKRITTHQLNKFVEKAMQRNHPPMIGGKRLRIYYMAQVGVQPPTFILFVNHPSLMLDSYKKYLYNQFREEYGFTGAPINIFLKGKTKKDKHERLEKQSRIAQSTSEPSQKQINQAHFEADHEVYNEADDDFEEFEDNWDDEEIEDSKN